MKLEQAARTQLLAIIPVNDLIITPTIKLIEVIDETTIPAMGEPGTNVNIFMRLRYHAQVVAEQEITKLATAILEANTPSGYTALENTLTIKQVTSPILGEDGLAHWTINPQRKLQAMIAVDQAINLIKGLSTFSAVQRLSESLPLSAETQIMLTPAWWPHIPILPMRIVVLQAATK
jgi:hypothetical protein